MSDRRRDRRLIDRQLLGLDPRDNISVIPCCGVWNVMRGAARVEFFQSQVAALGAARRLADALGTERGTRE